MMADLRLPFLGWVEERVSLIDNLGVASSQGGNANDSRAGK